MAIVKMSKFDLFAFETDRRALLEELQRFEYVHFILPEEEDEATLESVSVPLEMAELNEEITKLSWMMETLEPYVKKEGAIEKLKKGLVNYHFEDLDRMAQKVEWEPVYREMKEITGRIDQIRQSIAANQSVIKETEPWAPLSSELSDLKSSERSVVLTGSVPKGNMESLKNALLDFSLTFVDEVSEARGQCYVVAIILREEYNKAIEVLRKNGFSRLDIPGTMTPTAEIKRYQTENTEFYKEEAALKERLVALTEKLNDLYLVYEAKMNRRVQLDATEKFKKLRDLNVISGYIPTTMREDFEQVTEKILGKDYFLEIEEADKEDENVPILLKNNKFTHAFESITSMFALPRYNEVDPTPFFAIFYWAFFGMMVADIGYGALMLIGSVIALKSFNLSDKTKSFIQFFFYLSFSTMIWGVVYGSLFGLDMPFKLIDINNDAILLLLLSVVFGGIHLFYAMAIQAYIKIRDGQPMDAVYDVLFWYMALMGGIVFLLSKSLSQLPASAATISMWVMIVGMVGIVLFGGRDAKSPVGRFFGGLYSLYGISGYVGDFVSYSRLMALGLAGGFIAVAINMIVQMVVGTIPGIIIGAIVFLGGHLFNAFLSILSAYVHTSRLTYVEFFGKFYEGGGKAFDHFRNEPKYININNK